MPPYPTPLKRVARPCSGSVRIRTASGSASRGGPSGTRGPGRRRPTRRPPDGDGQDDLDEPAAELVEVLDQRHVARRRSCPRPGRCRSRSAGRQAGSSGRRRPGWCRWRPPRGGSAAVETSWGPPGDCGFMRGSEAASSASRALGQLALEPGGDLSDLRHHLADLAGGLRELGGAEHDQRHQEDDEHLGPADVEHRVDPTGRPVPRPVAPPAGLAGPGRRGLISQRGRGRRPRPEPGRFAARGPWSPARGRGSKPWISSGNSSQSQAMGPVWPRVGSGVVVPGPGSRTSCRRGAACRGRSRRSSWVIVLEVRTLFDFGRGVAGRPWPPHWRAGRVDGGVSDRLYDRHRTARAREGVGTRNRPVRSLRTLDARGW